MLFPDPISSFPYILIHQQCGQAVTASHRPCPISTLVSQPMAQPPGERRKGSCSFSKSVFAAQAPLLLRLPPPMVASWGISALPAFRDKPCLSEERGVSGWRRRGEGWSLGKCSTRNSFVLFDLRLKYIWKAAETLTQNRLPTQMLSTKKLPGIIILSIYQFVIRI